MIYHRSLLTEDSKKVVCEGHKAKYVCTTELVEGNNTPVDVFYADKPHKDSGSRYFGMFFDNRRDAWCICNASMIEDLNFAVILDDNKTWHYSRFRHDHFTTPCGKMIDGGRAYVRNSLEGRMSTAKVIAGEMVVIEDVDNV